MCKTYDAIYELRKHVDSSYLIVWVDDTKIKGELYCCDDRDCKCFKDVITLKDATISCPKTNSEHKIKWINVPSMWVKAFAFECCLMD
ncbi:MAG: hypothetical protein E7Z91_05265 [Cyanobacteria bacterium SIG30]|nr:hypothetical protein [Cyanobacteria bacterium SIG30]